MSIIITTELLPSLSPLLKNLWNWVFGVSYSFQFSRKSSEILWVWMAVICATQPVHCVKLNCLFFTDSMEAWWLCGLFLRRIDYTEFCHSGQQLYSKDANLKRHGGVKWQHVLLGLTCVTARPQLPVSTLLTRLYLFTIFLFIVSCWQHNNLLQKHRWRIHAINIHLWKHVVRRPNLQIKRT